MYANNLNDTWPNIHMQHKQNNKHIIINKKHQQRNTHTETEQQRRRQRHRQQQQQTYNKTHIPTNTTTRNTLLQQNRTTIKPTNKLTAKTQNAPSTSFPKTKNVGRTWQKPSNWNPWRGWVEGSKGLGFLFWNTYPVVFVCPFFFGGGSVLFFGGFSMLQWCSHVLIRRSLMFR